MVRTPSRNLTLAGLGGVAREGMRLGAHLDARGVHSGMGAGIRGCAKGKEGMT